MLSNKRRLHSGFSLVELMVALTIGLFILLGLTTFLSNNLRSSAQLAAATRLNQEMRAIMTLMSRDLRRAGYWGNATSGIGATVALYSNPFDAIDVATAGCILYSYDLDENGTLTGSEQFGFLLDSGTVKARSTSSGSPSCASGAAWQPLSDPNTVTYSSLTFQVSSTKNYITGTAGPNATQRVVTVTLSGALKSDSTVKQTLTEQIKIENDLFQAS